VRSVATHHRAIKNGRLKWSTEIWGRRFCILLLHEHGVLLLTTTHFVFLLTQSVLHFVLLSAKSFFFPQSGFFVLTLLHFPVTFLPLPILFALPEFYIPIENDLKIKIKKVFHIGE
jgi:hypothetical protein